VQGERTWRHRPMEVQDMFGLSTTNSLIGGAMSASPNA